MNIDAFALYDFLNLIHFGVPQFESSSTIFYAHKTETK